MTVKPGLSSLCVVQFWELDTDHDFYICKEDLLRYGNHSLTYRIVDRIFSQVSSPHALLRHVPTSLDTPMQGGRKTSAC